MLSPMSAPMTTATPSSTASSGLATAVAAMITTVSPGHEQPDEHARLEHDRDAREKSPHDGIDTLHGVEEPRQELVHAPSLGA